MAITEISFAVTKEESLLAAKIANRARLLGDPRSTVDIAMDIEATHANGCPLDLEKLYEFDDFNFKHDIYGIARHIDRRTGKLTRCFLPRCAK